MTNRPDLFTNVHKGIRRALFSTCLALGKARDETVSAALRAELRRVLHFVRHHGENEELLLLPMLAETAPVVHGRMRAAHAEIDALLLALEGRVDGGGATELYHGLCELAARYLEHMREEELELEPRIAAALTLEQMHEFGRASVARTAPEDARVMLGWMLPAMPPSQAREFLARLPPELERELRGLVDAGD
jgi:hypothetical protein